MESQRRPQYQEVFRTLQVSDALYERIRSAFISGHSEVWRVCRSLQVDIIREHVLKGVSLDPYFEVLDHLRDAVCSGNQSTNIKSGEIQGDWQTAIAAARDHVAFRSRGTGHREKTWTREFTVARAAKTLKQAGFEIEFAPGQLNLSNAGETKLVWEIESLTRQIGGLNVARRIFNAIARSYDVSQGRYHLVPPVSMTGGGQPQVPWGYLLQLAVKHIAGDQLRRDEDRNWQRLIGLISAYASIIDVQHYNSMIFFHAIDAEKMLISLRELAVYDTLFRIPQIRPSDINLLIRGMLDFLDFSIPTNKCWSINQVLSVIEHIINSTKNIRGPYLFRIRDLYKFLPKIPKAVIKTIVDDVLCHPEVGANQRFSYPTDAPTPEDKKRGITFSSRPLLKIGSRYCLIDQSVCAPAFIEALLTELRHERKGLGPVRS